MQRFFRLVLDHPRTVIFTSIALVAVLSWKLPSLTVNPDMEALIPQDNPELLQMHALEDQFGGQDMALILVQAPDVFAPSVLQALRQLTDTLETLPYADRVTSLTNYLTITGDTSGMVVENLIPEDTLLPPDSLYQRALTDSLVMGSLVSYNRRYSLISVYAISEASDAQIYHDLATIISAFRSDSLGLELSGLPILRHSISRDINHDVRLFVPLGMALMALLLSFSFRSLRGLLLPMAVVLLSIGATLGLMAWLNYPLTIVTSVLPIMLIAIANDYGIHVITRYYEDLDAMEGAELKSVLFHGIQRVSRPILLAGLTTLAGFLALLSHILPAARELGIFTSFGILLSFILTITFIPAWLELLPLPGTKQKRHNASDRWLARILEQAGKLIYRHRRMVLGVTAIFVLLAAWGLRLVKVDSNPLNYYPPGSRVQRVHQIVDHHLGGSTSFSVVFHGEIKNPALLRRMSLIQEFLAHQQAVGTTISPADFVKKINQAMHAGDRREYRLPDSRELVSQYLLLYQLQAPDNVLDRYVDYDFTTGRIAVRLATLSIEGMENVIQRLRAYVKQHFDREQQPEVVGYAVLLGRLIPMLIQGQIRSLILSALLVALLTGLFFRSFSAAWITALPVSLGILAVFGLMGYQGVPINATTSMLSSIVVGIGIDYSIHFLYRFRDEIQAGRGDLEAYRIALKTTGVGIVINAFSVILGFSVSMVSSFVPVFFFGWLILISISVCLICAFTILPLTVITFRPAFIYQR